MKIGFYLQNNGIKDVDCRTPEEGNPGIGGTEYLFIAIPYALSRYGCIYDVSLIANHVHNLPASLKTVQVSSDSELKNNSTVRGLDYLVVRHSPKNFELIHTLPPSVKVIMWAHNFVKRTELSALANCKRVACIVCVGSEQLNFYRDHKAYYKSVTIFNAYPIDSFINSHANEVIPFNSRAHEVTFLGNMVDFKGFHLLAQAWKKIIGKIPDARLNVIGGAKLYNRNQKLGKWGIAEENYEETFMPYLLDDDGELLPSVKFHGVMGNEKSEILRTTKVGVPNPSGVSETFCIAALEMQLWGAKIVTINYGGFKDTVRWGDLYESPNNLADYIIDALLDTNDEYLRALQEIKRFDFYAISKDWNTLFDALASETSLNNVLKPSFKGHKWKERNRKLKRFLPFGYCLPTIMFYTSIINRLFKR